MISAISLCMEGIIILDWDSQSAKAIRFLALVSVRAVFIAAGHLDSCWHPPVSTVSRGLYCIFLPVITSSHLGRPALARSRHLSPHPEVTCLHVLLPLALVILSLGLCRSVLPPGHFLSNSLSFWQGIVLLEPGLQLQCVCVCVVVTYLFTQTASPPARSSPGHWLLPKLEGAVTSRGCSRPYLLLMQWCVKCDNPE